MLALLLCNYVPSRLTVCFLFAYADIFCFLQRYFLIQINLSLVILSQRATNYNINVLLANQREHVPKVSYACVKRSWRMRRARARLWAWHQCLFPRRWRTILTLHMYTYLTLTHTHTFCQTLRTLITPVSFCLLTRVLTCFRDSCRFLETIRAVLLRFHFYFFFLFVMLLCLLLIMGDNAFFFFLFFSPFICGVATLRLPSRTKWSECEIGGDKRPRWYCFHDSDFRRYLM